MLIQSGQEALYVAIEMERGAVQTYERALMLAEPCGQAAKELRVHLESILSDERQHLRQFQSLYQGLDETMEQRLMLAAVASSILFEGGLLGAVRRGMLKDSDSLLQFAAQAEAKAIETYRAFAGTCGSAEAAAILNGIAAEEENHLRTLKTYL